MKDIELPPLPDADVTNSTNLFGYRYSYSAIAMQAYARAAVEADRAQRVPDGWANLLYAAREVLSWTQAADRTPVRDEFECGRMTGVRVHALADLHEAVQALASTPAQPAQQEPSDATIAQIDREIEAMLTQVESGSFPEFPARTLELAREVAKLIVAQHQEPPHQERKPMTPEQVGIVCDSAGYLENGMAKTDFINGIRHAERHHGIKE